MSACLHRTSSNHLVRRGFARCRNLDTASDNTGAIPIKRDLMPAKDSERMQTTSSERRMRINFGGLWQRGDRYQMNPENGPGDRREKRFLRRQGRRCRM